MPSSPLDELFPYDFGDTDAGPVDRLTPDNTAFALDLYNQLCRESDNVFISPFSIWAVLALARAGASGETAAQIDRVMHINSASEKQLQLFTATDGAIERVRECGDVRLESAIGLWPHSNCPILESYSDLTKRVFRAGITRLNYGDPESARQLINAWAEQRTNNRIAELIPAGAIDSLTRLVLTSAVYFRGAWAEPFDPDDTVKLPFFVSEAESVTVPMMHTVSCFGYAETAEAQLLEMPYVGHDISMLLLLPRSIDGLRQIESTITANDLEIWSSQMESQDVIVTLPRFRIETSCELGDALKSLGMTDAFDIDIADFSLIDGHRGSLCFSRVFHKAFIDVNEEGTEAAAATAGAMEKEEDDSQTPPQFRADHPFLLLLRERSSGTVLFLGRLRYPEDTP